MTKPSSKTTLTLADRLVPLLGGPDRAELVLVHLASWANDVADAPGTRWMVAIAMRTASIRFLREADTLRQEAAAAQARRTRETFEGLFQGGGR